MSPGLFWHKKNINSYGKFKCKIVESNQLVWRVVEDSGNTFKTVLRVVFVFQKSGSLSLWLECNDNRWEDQSGTVRDLQEPERSCLISSLSGMSWMAALIFSLIAFTALCHFRLQWRRSSSQSVDTERFDNINICWFGLILFICCRHQLVLPEKKHEPLVYT